MICNYPRLCHGLEPYILGDWTPDVKDTGLYRYVVKNTRTGISALYGVVLSKQGERPVWLNACPSCRAEFDPWLVSGKRCNGTSV